MQHSAVVFLIHPLVIAVAAHKNQRQTLALSGIAHEKDGLVVPAVGTVGILGPCQSRIVTDGTRNRV